MWRVRTWSSDQRCCQWELWPCSLYSLKQLVQSILFLHPVALVDIPPDHQCHWCHVQTDSAQFTLSWWGHVQVQPGAARARGEGGQDWRAQVLGLLPPVKNCQKPQNQRNRIFVVWVVNKTCGARVHDSDWTKSMIMIIWWNVKCMPNFNELFISFTTNKLIL